MPIKDFPQGKRQFEIQAYERPTDYGELRKTHVPFSGSPQKHPYDPEKVVLIIDPVGGNFSYYEFTADDISYAEELPSIVNLDGETIMMARIWVKKRSVGWRCTPFLVEDMRP